MIFNAKCFKACFLWFVYCCFDVILKKLQYQQTPCSLSNMFAILLMAERYSITALQTWHMYANNPQTLLTWQEQRSKVCLRFVSSLVACPRNTSRNLSFVGEFAIQKPRTPSKYFYTSSTSSVPNWILTNYSHSIIKIEYSPGKLCFPWRN